MPQRDGDRLVLKTIVVGLALMLAAGCGFVCGGFRTEVKAYHSLFLREERAIREVLGSDPAFNRVEVWESKDGEAHLRGEVETEADMERLRVAMLKAFGESRGLGGVQVRKPKR
jgi:hypothetical protein